MAESTNYWIFSNTAPGAYNGDDWDMQTIFNRKQYYLKQNEGNRSRVQSGDIAIIRVYGDGFWGKFIVGGWKKDPHGQKKYKKSTGYFSMEKITRWNRVLPQNLVWTDLSTNDVRSRVVRITAEDAITIEIAQRIYSRLGFGSADGEIIILEKGLEEAIKPNLQSLGLHLADENIQEQYWMGPGVGRSDLICLDKNDNLVVIELKRGRSSNEVVGQVLTYVGYVKQNIAKPKQKVHGWIITGSYDESLRLASLAAGIKIIVVRLP